MYKSFQKTTTLIEKIIYYVIIVIFIVLVFSCNIQVITRALGITAPWTEELARYMAVWLTFLGSAYTFRKKAMVSVEMLIDRLKGRNKQVLQMIILIISIGFSGLMAIIGTRLSMKVAIQNTPVLNLPMYYVYSALPIAGVLMLLFSVEQFYDCVKNLKSEGRR